MTSGKNLYREFSDFRASIEDELNDVNRKISAITRENEGAETEKDRLWDKAANIRLSENDEKPAEIQRALKKRIQNVETKKSELSEYQRLMDVAANQNAIFKGKINTVLHDINEQENSILKALEGDEHYASLTNRFALLEQAAKDLTSKLQRAEEERDQKRKAYENDQIFAYLTKRRFGTPEYSGRFLFRALDRRLANAISFSEATENYKRLLEIPKWIEDRAQKLGPDMEVLRHEIDDIKSKALVATKEQHAVLEGFKKQYDDATEAMRFNSTAVDKIKRYLTEVDNNNDKDMKDIHDLYVSILKRDGLAKALEFSKHFSSLDYSKFITRIVEIDDEIKRRNLKIRDLEAKAADLAEKIDGLDRIEQKIAENSWDRNGHSFSGVSVDDLTRGYMQGSFSEGVIIGMLINSHQETETYSSRRSDSDYGNGNYGRSGGSGGDDDSSSRRNRNDDDSGSKWATGGDIGGGNSSDNYSTGGDIGGGNSSDNYTTGGDF